jgi:hypothetical protein
MGLARASDRVQREPKSGSGENLEVGLAGASRQDRLEL